VLSRTPPTSRSVPHTRRLSDSASNPDGRRNLWQRLKTSSSNNLLDSQSPSSSPSKGRISGIFSAGKGLLTGNSNLRT
jgi:hypothetical protein